MARHKLSIKNKKSGAHFLAKTQQQNNSNCIKMVIQEGLLGTDKTNISVIKDSLKQNSTAGWKVIVLGQIHAQERGNIYKKQIHAQERGNIYKNQLNDFHIFTTLNFGVNCTCQSVILLSLHNMICPAYSELHTLPQCCLLATEFDGMRP
jgi:hypothetical protein